MLEKEEYESFDAVIEKINKQCISPDPKKYEQYKEVFEDFLNKFRVHLRKNEPVLNLYKEIQYTGSVYEDLYVGPVYKEFDMNICLNFPAHFIRVTESFFGGFVSFQLDVKNNYDDEIRKTINSWLDEEKYVIPTKFYNWGKGAVDKIFNYLFTYENEYVFYDFLINHGQSGPVYTIGVKKMNTDIQFDVDIVFTFKFDTPPPRILNDNFKDWSLVAKSPKVDEENAIKIWRLSFSIAEKALIHDKMKLKNIIRLIKKIINKENLHYIASYHIKSVFFDYMAKVPDNFWEQKSLGYLLRKMLDELLNSLKSGVIRFYWDKRLNLIANLDDGQLCNATNKIQSIINDMDKSLQLKRYDDIKYILLTPEEVKNYDQNNAQLIFAKKKEFAKCTLLRNASESDLLDRKIIEQQNYQHL